MTALGRNCIVSGCAGRHILAIQDTREINFTTTRERSRGLGEIGKCSGRGVLLHAMLGSDAETDVILGLATGRVWTHDGRVTALALVMGGPRDQRGRLRIIDVAGNRPVPDLFDRFIDCEQWH